MKPVRTISIMCGRCKRHVFLAQKQGQNRRYCDTCTPIVKRENRAARNRAYRARRKSQVDQLGPPAGARQTTRTRRSGSPLSDLSYADEYLDFRRRWGHLRGLWG